MKAMVYHQYGLPDQLRLQEILTPTVGADHVLVKVHAASLNRLDWHFLTGRPYLARLMAGLFRPKNTVLGVDFAGRVSAVGENVHACKPGDEVFGSTSHGCFAEYVRLRADELQPKPVGLPFVEAAAVGAAATTALQGLRDQGRIKAGQKVLINGASGEVGLFAVQIAKSMDAEVTGVCSTRNLDLVRAIGADFVIDYRREEFTQMEKHYDLIFDAAAKSSFAACNRILNPEGIYVTTEFSPLLVLKGLWMSISGNKKQAALLARPPDQQDLRWLKDQLENGKMKVIIDRCYPLGDLPEALRYLADGKARGKIVVTMGVEHSGRDGES